MIHLTVLAYCVGGALALLLLYRLQGRIELSLAKHPSITGHARLARLVSRLVPFYEYEETQFFRADDASPELAARRRAGFERLAALYAERFARTAAASEESAGAIADWQFTARYRVPFQFSSLVRRSLRTGGLVCRSSGRMLFDLDGNRLYDLTGSYGVNVFGYDFYKECIAQGGEHVRELGPVLGACHPLIAYNVQRLREISRLDQVSFHMSGTEAVMQAVRLARFHTRRRFLVRFSGAYHGWWGEVQPGAGNPTVARDTLTLREMHPAALRVLRRRGDIACVLINPLQALHPNAGAPSDSMLTDSARQAHFDAQAYQRWLQQLRTVCSGRGIVLIFDEVFLGFRLAPGGAQEYFGVAADLVTYGKTVGGGLPIGVLCGRADLMRRYREDRPADICFARGTFNSHPYVMGAMYEFLQRLSSPAVQALYHDLDGIWNARAAALNRRLQDQDLNVRVANLSSVWTVWYPRASRYNWMLQFYLHAQGLALSWVGTGRLIFSLDYTEADFTEVSDRFVAAARQMQADGWWSGKLSNQAIRRRVLREMLRARWRHGASGRSAPHAAGTAVLGNRA